MNTKDIDSRKNYLLKINKFIFDQEKNKQNISILEFGVREGRSTQMFLNICKKNDGKLISVDLDDYSKLFKDDNWTFIKSRDDDYKAISNNFSNDFDVILIDSFHEPNHVKKIIYMYWKHLKISGSMYIDDISWLPYLKNNWRDHEYTENINKDTFQKLLDIMLTNNDNIIMEFIFNGSGMCRITKLENKPLSEPKYIKSRNNFFKKLIKKITNIKN